MICCELVSKSWLDCLTSLVLQLASMSFIMFYPGGDVFTHTASWQRTLSLGVSWREGKVSAQDVFLGANTFAPVAPGSGAYVSY